MRFKSPEVHETQLLESPGGSPEKKSRKDSFPWLQSKGTECSLDTVHKHGWKPLSVTAPVLFSFAFASFLLAAIIEVLAQESQRKGGLALSPSATEIPAFANFCYLFLPTIIAVIYSLLWSWIDLDVKRIQPWFEMSRSTGATAERSILLDYPYEFVGFVPQRAARRRHWAVFYAGTVMVLIFWLITPLQSAILGSGPVDVRREISTSSPTVLRPVSEQMSLMDQSVLNEAYALTWLNQAYPPYTTPEYTLLPFDAVGSTPMTPSSNLTGTTTKYWTDINCWSAEVFQNGPKAKKSFDFLNGRGCNASEISPFGSFKPATPYKILYIGYEVSPYVDYSLRSPSCPKSTSFHQYLAVLSRFNETIDDDVKLTSIFCETEYYKQQVNVTVSAQTKAPLEGSLVPVGPREKLTDAEFNATALEYLMGSSVAPDELTATREYPFDHILQQHPRTSNKGLTWPMSPMAGFAVGTQNITSLDAFQDEAALGQAFNASHKMVFSIAMRRVLTNSSSKATADGVVHFERHGIIVSRLFAAIVEVLLFVVGIFTILLWWHCHRAPSKLMDDPASLGSLISICQNSSTLLDKFSGKGALSEDLLKAAFKDERFHLLCGCENRSGETVINVVNVGDKDNKPYRVSLSEPGSGLSVGHYSPVKPLALRREVGAFVALSMVGVVVALVYLKVLERRGNGLIRPNTSFEVLQLLENYIPTVFATLLEPFWVLLNRLLCIIQPFKDLWYGRKTAKGSISARYTSVPPQFVFWRAARSGHFLLSALCSIALLSNLLAVGLGGLFNEFPRPVTYPLDFEHPLTSQMNETLEKLETTLLFGPAFEYEDIALVAMYNISQGTTLPPWTGKDHFFQPFSPVSEDDTQAVTYTAPARGFGVVPSCSTAGTYKTRGKGPKINETIETQFEPINGCAWPDEFGAMLNYRTTEGAAAIELIEMINSSSRAYGPCGTPLILGWGRSSQTEDTENGEMDSTFVLCRPSFTTAMFNVTVDTRGYVLDAVRTSDAELGLPYPKSRNHTDQLISMLNKLLLTGSPAWHNDTLSNDWMSYLLKIRTGDDRLQDPSAPLPDAASLVAPVEAIYQQLFALVLGLNYNDVFLPDQAPAAIQGTARRDEIRIFMDSKALAISLAVLGLNIFVAALVYGFSIVHFLPRLPTTVGSMIAYLAPSRAMREYEHHHRGTPGGGGGGLRHGTTFSFGRFVGDDGRAHVGIELDPYVVPVHLKSLRKGDTSPGNSILRRLLRRKGEARRGDTWL